MSRHVRPSRALTVAVSASLLLTLGIASPAVAVDYPSWDDVQAARQNQAAAAAEADRIEGYLVALESKAAALGRTAQAKGEEYNQALELLDAASDRAERLQRQATDAAAAARVSIRRAGQLVAQAARTGGSSLSVSVFVSADPDRLLDALGTMSKLTERSTEIYERAEHDEKVAESLTAGALAAVSEREKLAASAQQALDEANAASEDLLAQLSAQHAAADQLYEQLAALKGTTAETERQYLAGITDPPTPPAPPASVPVTQPAPPVNPGPPTTPTQPTQPTPTQPTPTQPVEPTPPAPSPSAVEAAIAYAYAQVGDQYEYGGSGPDSWDCSGLTKAAYAAAGVYIGAHGSTSQYRYLAGQGRLVPVSQLQRGDLVFYSDDGGASTYHVALYLGGGQMIEAQYEGVPVKVSNLRYYDLMYYAARPTG